MALVFKCDVCGQEAKHVASFIRFNKEGEVKEEDEFCNKCALGVEKIITHSNADLKAFLVSIKRKESSALIKHKKI